MKMQRFIALCLSVLPWPILAGPYDAPAERGAKWLSLATQQNDDGSWGDLPGIREVYTSAVVSALDKAYQREEAYYKGITWLENNAANNVDVMSRFIDVLSPHKDNLTYLSGTLQNQQDKVGAAFLGWGLSAAYTSSPIDTALALIAYDSIDKTVNTAQAITYLKSSQRNVAANDKGWPMSYVGTSDPVATALVVQALSRWAATDTTLSLPISNALTTLNQLVPITAPILYQALVAQAAQDAGNPTIATAFLNRLVTAQAADGSWDTDPFVTAVATRALATAAKLSDMANSVNVPDQQLRKAINLALGRNAMDALNRGELAQLTGLTAINQGISDLTGLEWATNLTSVNVNNNNLSAITPLANLTKLTSISWTGNPGNPGPAPATARQLPSPSVLKELRCRRGRYLGNC
jgi:hypothetical protein